MTDKIEEDEFPMYEALERYLAKKNGRPYRCPYCHQRIVSGMMTVQRKFKFGRNPKARRIILSYFHLICWVEMDGRIQNEMFCLKRIAFGRRRQVSSLDILSKISS